MIQLYSLRVDEGTENPTPFINIQSAKLCYRHVSTSQQLMAEGDIGKRYHTRGEVFPIAKVLHTLWGEVTVFFFFFFQLLRCTLHTLQPQRVSHTRGKAQAHVCVGKGRILNFKMNVAHFDIIVNLLLIDIAKKGKSVI